MNKDTTTPKPTDSEPPSHEGLDGAACCPSLDCSRDELVAYIRSMRGGERVMEMERSAMYGLKGTVEIRNGDVCIRWDHVEYADGAGVMVTSFTGGARIIQDNAESIHGGKEPES